MFLVALDQAQTVRAVVYLTWLISLGVSIRYKDPVEESLHLLHFRKVHDMLYVDDASTCSHVPHRPSYTAVPKSGSVLACRRR